LWESKTTARNTVGLDGYLTLSTTAPFLKFIATPVDERNKQFKIDLTDENGQKKSTYQIVHEQLEQLLKFDSPWNTEVYRDCHIDAVCIDTN
ncbi:hypothetical protein ITF16_14350, partial [Acinetobacter baumannii]|nr:hypothetical protein [Acinetobacter baumannii]